MKKYISPEIEAIVLRTAEDCLTISANKNQIDSLDFYDGFSWE